MFTLVLKPSHEKQLELWNLDIQRVCLIQTVR